VKKGRGEGERFLEGQGIDMEKRMIRLEVGNERERKNRQHVRSVIAMSGLNITVGGGRKDQERGIARKTLNETEKKASTGGIIQKPSCRKRGGKRPTIHRPGGN